MKSEKDYFKKMLDNMSKDVQKRHSDKMNEVNFCISFDGKFPEDPKKRSGEIFSKYYMGVDIQEGKTSVRVSPFKFEKVPHLMEPLKMLSPDSDIEMVTVYKGQSCGASTSVIDNYHEYMNEKSIEAVEIYMEDLKSKYPDYIFGILLKSKNHGIIILDEAVDISEIEPLDSIVGVKRASEIKKRYLLPILTGGNK